MAWQLLCGREGNSAEGGGSGTEDGWMLPRRPPPPPLQTSTPADSVRQPLLT